MNTTTEGSLLLITILCGELATANNTRLLVYDGYFSANGAYHLDIKWSYNFTSTILPTPAQGFVVLADSTHTYAVQNSNGVRIQVDFLKYFSFAKYQNVVINSGCGT